MSAKTDEHFMQRALLLAKRGLFTTHPNPRVGCVLVKEGKVVGEGWHQQAGGPHAEIVALSAVGAAAKGTTCYVTLEPCCHHGKTPPCVPALIKAGVKRVVIATLDPNSVVSGNGIRALKQAGVEICLGILSKASQQLNPGFFKRMQHQRPFIRCKLAMSLDGRTAAADGKSQWITSEPARQDVQCWRAQSSGILTSVNTILADDPRLTVRGITIVKQPLRIILDTHLRVSPKAAVFAESQSVVIFTNCEEVSKINVFEKKGVRVIHTVLSNCKLPQRLELSKILVMLATQFEQNEILVEAGSTLAGAFLSEGWVDELVFYVAPKIFGNLAFSAFNLPELRTLKQAIPLKIREMSQCGEDWRIIARPGV